MVRLFVDDGGRRIGANFALVDNEELPPSPLAEIIIREIVEGETRLLDVSTSTKDLYRHFYALLMDMVDRIVREDLHPLIALRRSLSSWRTLLRTLVLLTNEQQTGLFGELWMFARLLPRFGVHTIDAWVGPLQQPHDFRIGNDEFEIKTTTASKRSHVINGVTQLQHSVGCRLFLVSLQLARAGPAGGRSLPELVRHLLQGLSRWPSAHDRFIRVLEETLRFRLADADQYPQRWQMRTQPALIRVTAGCPRLVTKALQRLPPEYGTDRISDLVYRINVEGLGFTDGHPKFLSILPKVEETPQ